MATPGTAAYNGHGLSGKWVNRRATYSIIPSFKAITTALTRSSV